jgi:hypothetical protein
MFDRNIDSITASLPAPVNGQAHFLTTDNRIYFAVGGVYYQTPVPKWFVIKLKTSGDTYEFNGTSLVQIDTPTSLDSRLDAVETTVVSLGTAAFEDIGFFATQADLNSIQSSSVLYERGAVVPISTVQDMLNSTYINLWEFADLVTSKPNPSDPNTWDWTPAIQACVNAANGTPILVPPGTYRVTSMITYYNISGVIKPQGFKLQGYGRGVTIFKNEVVGGYCFDINTGIGATTSSVEFFSFGGYFKDLSIVGDATILNSGGIRFRSCWEYQLVQMECTKHTGAGIYIDHDNTMNPDFTASANMYLLGVHLTYNKYGAYSPGTNSWPTHKFQSSFVSWNTDIGIYANSSHMQYVQTAVAFNGTAYVGDGSPSQAFGGIVVYQSNYEPKSIVVDGCEMDNNKPQHYLQAGGRCPTLRNNVFANRYISGYLNKHSIVFGDTTSPSGIFLDDFKVELNSFIITPSIVGSGKTHSFVKTRAYTRAGEMGYNSYGIVGATIGTEVKWIEEDVKASPYTTSSNHRTRCKKQNYSSDALGYSLQFGIPWSAQAVNDDAVLSIRPLQDRGFIMLSVNAGNKENAAILGYTTRAGVISTFKVAQDTTAVSPRINVVTGAQTLTGNTGTDGFFTVAVGADGLLYFENRLGATVGVTMEYFGGYSGFNT